MLTTIKAFLLGVLGEIVVAIITAILSLVAKIVFSLVLMLIQIFFRNGIAATNFVNFNQIITMFGRITNLNELGTVVYSISAFIIAFGIIVSGVKMSAGFLDKTGDSPQAFFKRILYTVILLIGYKTIVSYVIEIMNAIASTGPFNMTDNLNIFGDNIISVFGNFLDSAFDGQALQVTDLVSLLVSIVLYCILISKLIPSIITYYERYISFAIYLLMGPVVISLGIDPENKDIGKNWLMGILSQMMVILFSMFVYNLFLLQLKAFLFGDGTITADQLVNVNGELQIAVGLSTNTVANLICCCVLLTIVEKSEQFINMLGLRTIPSGDTARTFAGRIASTFHNGLHIAGGAINKTQDFFQGTGRKNGYTNLQKMASTLGIPNANVLDKNTNLNNVARDRVSGILHKNGGTISKDDRKQLIKQLVREGGVGLPEATKAVDAQIEKVSKEAASINKSFGDAIKNGTGFSSEDLQKKVGMSEDVIKLKKGTAREVYNKDTGSNVLGHTEDGQEIHGFSVMDSKGNAQMAILKGKEDENGNFVGKTLTDEDLSRLNGTNLAFKSDGNEKDIDSPQVQSKFKDDAQFKNLYDDAKDCQAKVERGEATREELQERVGALQQYIDNHGGAEIDPNSFASDEKIADKFKDDEKFQSKVTEFDNARTQFDNGQISEKELNEKANDLRSYISKNGGDEELQAFDDGIAKAKEDKEKASFVSIGKFDSNNVTPSDSNFSAAYMKLGTQVKELDAKENNGANIATSQVKFDDKTGEMYVETNTYKGDIKRDITTDRDGNQVVRETNQLKEVTSGARVDTSDSAFERDAASNFTGQEFGSTFKRFDNASDDSIVKNVKYTDSYGVEHDDGTRLKNKADYVAAERESTREFNKQLDEDHYAREEEHTQKMHDMRVANAKEIGSLNKDEKTAFYANDNADKRLHEKEKWNREDAKQAQKQAKKEEKLKKEELKKQAEQLNNSQNDKK